MEEILIPYAYLALFLGCMIKGEAVLIAAIFATERGYFDLGLVLLIAFAATLSSDYLFYFMGRKRSRRILWNRPDLIPFAEKLYVKLKHSPLKVFIAHQFLNGFTQRVPYITGTSNLKLTRFIWYSFIASALWIVTLFCLAFLLNFTLEGYLGASEFYELGLLVGILVAGLLIQLTIHIRREQNIKENIQNGNPSRPISKANV